MARTLAHFPANPDYGRGIYRRRLQFAADPTGMVAQVDDTHHSYWLAIDHNNIRVQSIDAGFMRSPTTACAGATAGLIALVGLPVAAPVSETLARLPVASNCTHLTDLACWSLAQAGRSALWEITVPDQVREPVWVEIARDGGAVHRWQIANHHILAPSNLTGRPMMKGFMNWARAAFEDDALLAATMLQRGLFVARGREHVVDRGEPVPLARAADMSGRCWSYSGNRRESATGTLNYVRDFTSGVTPEKPPSEVARRLQGAES